MLLREPRPGRPISLDDGVASGGFACRLGVEDDCGARGGGVEGRTGWSLACVDGAVPAEAGVPWSSDDPAEDIDLELAITPEIAEAVEEVEEAPMTGLSPVAGLPPPST